MAAQQSAAMIARLSRKKDIFTPLKTHDDGLLIVSVDRPRRQTKIQEQVVARLRHDDRVLTKCSLQIHFQALPLFNAQTRGVGSHVDAIRSSLALGLELDGLPRRDAAIDPVK